MGMILTEENDISLS